jgi:thiosulfate/3-mercaptopyruvate sulfurtransferase
MKTLRLALAASLLACTAGATARAAAPRDTLLVSTTWLAQHLEDANLVLLHVGDEAEYKAAHIPGALFLDVSKQLARHDDEKNLNLEMLPVEVLHDHLVALGISDNSRIVVYYGKDRITMTTRAMFTLDYAGLGGRASLLDGGMVAWTREGQKTTDAETPVPKPGTLVPLKIQPEVVDAAFVRAHLKSPGFAVVDARAPNYYDGSQNGATAGGPEKFGHLPGAMNVPFSETTDDKFMWKSPDELAALFSKAGVKSGETVIAYCHLGQQATATIFAARTLGFTVLLYDGSFQDWAARDLPVEKSPGRGSGPR